jgi:hypothetical protein
MTDQKGQTQNVDHALANADFLRVLAEAAEQYEVYRSLNELTVNVSQSQSPSSPDWESPLTLVIKTSR